MNDPLARAYLAVGSNIRPESNVVAAVELLAGTPGITVTGISTLYRTPALAGPGDAPPEAEPGHEPGDPDFLNGVLEVRTELSHVELLEVLQKVETGLGRVREEDPYAPRTLDLDLLLYASGKGQDSQPSWSPVRPDGDCVHPDVWTRSFVAIPLLELAPQLSLPPHGTPLKTLAERFPHPWGIPEARLTETLRSRFLQP